MKNEKIENRGGKRENAGRPKAENKKVTLSVRVLPETKEWLNSQSESSGNLIDKLVNDVKRG